MRGSYAARQPGERARLRGEEKIYGGKSRQAQPRKGGSAGQRKGGLAGEKRWFAGREIGGE